MTDAGYVLSGWVITGAAVGGYLARLWVRTRRAKKLLGATPVTPGGGAGVPADAAMSRQAKSHGHGGRQAKSHGHGGRQAKSHGHGGRQAKSHGHGEGDGWR